MSDTKQKMIELKQQIDSIKEYVDSELCKKCQEMYDSLVECQKLLQDHLSDECY